MPTETFNSPGSSTWTCPVGVTQVTAECWGAGGGGGAGDGGTTAGGGGGGGGYGIAGPISVTPGNGYAVTVGAGGASGVSGGQSLFIDGSTASGGGGAAGAAGVSSGGGGAGGNSVPSGFVGGNGGTGGDGNGGGGGGSSAGTAAAGNTGSDGTAGVGGAGASAPTDGGIGGNGGDSGDGSNGGAPGGGAGGGGPVGSGGIGADGQVKLSYSYGAPTCSGCTPSSGSVAGGTSVTLTTTNVRAGATVKFDGTPATGVSISPDGTSVTCDTPAHAAGVVDIVIENDDAQTGTLSSGFEYVGDGGGFDLVNGRIGNPLVRA